MAESVSGVISPPHLWADERIVDWPLFTHNNTNNNHHGHWYEDCPFDKSHCNRVIKIKQSPISHISTDRDSTSSQQDLSLETREWDGI